MSELKDKNWINFEISFSGGDILLTDGAVQSWMDNAITLHNQSSIKKIEMELGVLVIKFLDGRNWKITIKENSLNPDVSYDINKNHNWKRNFIINYITPLINQSVIINHNYNWAKIEGEPR